MLEKVYYIGEMYPDPYEIETKLESSIGTKIHNKMLSEVREAGLSSHPLLSRFFVES